MSKHYRVYWEVDIEDETATTFRQAALLAFQMMQRPGTIANYFTVEDAETGEKVDVDLEAEDISDEGYGSSDFEDGIFGEEAAES